MNLAAIVTQLETVTGLSGRVAVGSPTQMENVGDTPIAWISGLTETASSNPRVNSPAIQRIDTRVEITIGAKTLSEVQTTRDGVRAALVDFQPEAPGDPMEFRNSRMEFIDPGWVLWRDDYSYSYYYDKLEV